MNADDSILCSPFFSRQLKNIIKKFKLSEKSIMNDINTIKHNPSLGDRIPGYGELIIRKERKALKEYNLGKSKSLRIVFWSNSSQGVLFLLIYFKGDHNDENEILKMLRNSVKEAISNVDLITNAEIPSKKDSA